MIGCSTKHERVQQHAYPIWISVGVSSDNQVNTTAGDWKRVLGGSVWEEMENAKIVLFLIRPTVNIVMNKSISNEVDIVFHVLASQLSGDYRVISNRLWRLQQNVNRANEKWSRCARIVAFIVIYGFVCRVRKETMFVRSWRAVYALTRVLCWCLFPELQLKHQNNPLVALK